MILCDFSYPLKNIFVSIFGLTLYSFSLFCESIVYINALFFLYVISVVFLFSGKSILDPRGFFLLIFYIYSVFFSFQAVFVGNAALEIDVDDLAESVRLQFFFVIVMSTFFNLIIKSNPFLFERKLFFFKESRKSILFKNSEVIYLSVIAPLMFYGFYLIFTSGAESKREYLESSSSIEVFAYFSSLVMIALFGIRLVKIPPFKFDCLVFSILFIGLMFLFLNGERDVLFKLILIYCIVISDKKAFPVLPGSFLLLFLAIFIVPLSQFFKSSFLGGDIVVSKSGLELIFSNEFTSAGRNLYSLIFYGVEQDISYLYSDFIRAFTPKFFISGTDIQSSGAWFNNTFRVINDFSGTSGWGFTIVGNGYLIGGYCGVFFVAVIYASVLSVFYNIRFKNIYFYVFYLLLFLDAIYVIRADLANYFSQAIKVSGLIIFLVYCADCVLVKSSKRLIYER